MEHVFLVTLSKKGANFGALIFSYIVEGRGEFWSAYFKLHCRRKERVLERLFLVTLSKEGASFGALIFSNIVEGRGEFWSAYF